MRVSRSIAAVSGAAVIVATFASVSESTTRPAVSPTAISAQPVELPAHELTASYRTSGFLSDLFEQLREAMEKAAEAQAAAQRPAQVTGVKAGAGDQRIDLSWSAPSSRRSITSYTLAYSPAGGTTRTTKVSGTKTALTGLVNGAKYSITVAATSSGGTGPASTAVTATPFTVAAAPADLAVEPGDGVFAARWSAPADTGGVPVTEYVVTATPTSGDAEPVRVRSSGLEATLAGLRNGVVYTVSVAAVNAAGTGLSSVVKAVVPLAPAPEPIPEPTPEPTPTGGSFDIATSGYNGFGQLLTGSSDENAHQKAEIPTGGGSLLADKKIDKVSVGETSTCAIAEGTAYCWGGNSDGQLGDGTRTASSQPIAVAGALAGKTVTDIEAGIRQACAVADGEAFCWGANSDGQLGNGTTTAALTPVAVTNTGVLSGKKVERISTQLGHTCALAEGQAYCWGAGRYGQLGNGSGNDVRVPSAVSVAGVLKDKSVSHLSVGFLQSCAIADGKAFCWGYNGYGALGNNSTVSSNVPVAVFQQTGVMAGTTVTDIDSRSYSTCAVADGKAYCWGYNVYGPLGNDASNDRQVPIAVHATSGPLAGKTVAKVTTGFLSSGPYSATGCAVTTDGTAACWGTTNTYGNLATGTNAGTRTPVAVDVTGDLAGKEVTGISTNGRTTAFLAQ